MHASFSFSATTKLDRRSVWDLLTDLDNWSTCSVVYGKLEWLGEPWQCGSAIAGELTYPIEFSFNYTLKEFRPISCISYLAQSEEAGFATERTIHLEPLGSGTRIEVNAFAVGEPVFKVPEGSYGFLRALTEKWFQEFAAFCDTRWQATSQLISCPPAS